MSTIIVGQCQAVTEKPTGWTEFEIAVPGKQYPVRLATKKSELIQAGREVKDALATWTYTEKESETVNEHTGKPYVNRYLEGVEAGAAAPAEGGPEPHHEPVHFADKDRLISRQVCLKVAGTIYTGKALTVFESGSEDDVGKAVMAQAQRFEQWLYRDIDPVPFE